MNKARWVSAVAGAAMVATTLVLPAAGVAYASGNGNVTGNGNVGLLSGNSISAPISVPINLCGVSLGIVGFGNSGCEGGARSNVSSTPGNGGGGNSGNGNTVGNGNVGIGSGNTANVPVSAPVNVCGVSGGVVGYANSGCQGGAHSTVTQPSGGNGGNGGGNGNVTGIGNVSAVSGNTIDAPVSAPINLCSISLALLGFSNSGCQGGATSNVSGGASGSNGNVTGIGNVSALSGNTIDAPISAPVNLCSVSLAVAGFANSGCQGGAASNVSGGASGSNGNVTGIGNVGLVSGNTVNAPISVPVNVCAVSLGIVGFADSGCQGGAVVNPPACQGVDCGPGCQGANCGPGCQGANCGPGCQGANCGPGCQGANCGPGCQGANCGPGCQGANCGPGCQGANCSPGCTGTHCTPPACQGSACTLGGGTPAGPGPNGSGPGSTAVTSASMPNGTAASSLPTTGADLLLLGVAALGTIGVGAGAVTVARRRRGSETA